MGDQDTLWRALAHQVRRDIVRLASSGEKTAGEIASSFEMTRPAVSQHLAALRDAGLLLERREGTKRFYRADLGVLREVSRWLSQVGVVPPARTSPRPAAPAPRAPAVATFTVELDSRAAQAWRFLAEPDMRRRWKGDPEPEVLAMEPGRKVKWRWRWAAGAAGAVVEAELAADGRRSVLELVHRGEDSERWPVYLERLQAVARGWDPGPED